ncbi:NUDIX hydrolase domain-like protein [Gongronella butleri]|nr:NUDIX hydrolase domain-like protein [Gongronella butleri]
MTDAVPFEQPDIEYTKKARHGGTDVVNEENVRQVAGCLPIDVANKRFLLISSSKHPDRFVFPKGGWEVDESQAHAALRETWEEAGVKGVITRHLGVFEEATKKQVKAHHWIYELHIKEVAKKWPERKKRDRRWFTFEEALQVVKAPFMRDVIMLSCLNPANQPVPGTNQFVLSQPFAESIIGQPSTADLAVSNMPEQAPAQDQQQQQQQGKSSFKSGLKSLFGKK